MMNLLFVLGILAGVGFQAQAASSLGRGGKCVLVFKTITRSGPFAAYRVFKNIGAEYAPRRVDPEIHIRRYQNALKELSLSVDEDLTKLGDEALSLKLRQIVENQASAQNLLLIQNALLHRPSPLPGVWPLWSRFISQMDRYRLMPDFEVINNLKLGLVVDEPFLDNSIATVLQNIVRKSPPQIAAIHLTKIAIAEIHFAARGVVTYKTLLHSLADLANRVGWTEQALLAVVNEFWHTMQETFLHPELQRPNDRIADSILKVFLRMERDLKSELGRDVDYNIPLYSLKTRKLLGVEVAQRSRKKGL